MLICYAICYVSRNAGRDMFNVPLGAIDIYSAKRVVEDTLS